MSTESTTTTPGSAEDVAMTEAVVASAPRGARLVIAGSVSEYGWSGRHREDDRCEPKTCYGMARLAAGSLALACADQNGLDVTIARLYGVYGPGEAPQRLFPALLEAAVRRLAAGLGSPPPQRLAPGLSLDLFTQGAPAEAQPAVDPSPRGS